ncbi:Hsp70-Hsp90 organizing protein 2 [Mucuna pruriens]|uniref:Hsp70-Hsp90 organizing protein 2 n=1 Tax=Mucuna pruriens TaxID=157652 RepID=A0A371E2B6_MUCPR|nr:Hsp70-Hsp90 organizing protein 2 [Mucuna pruriens]
MAGETKEGSVSEMSLKDQGNEFFKSGKFLKAAALYTQAIKLDPSNPTLYSNRAAALLQLDKLNKALDDAEMTIKLKPQWEKGYFRKGSILEAMKRYDDALAAFQIALQYNPQSQEVSKKIKKINQLVRDSKRAQEVENMRSNVDMAKHLDALKPEMSGKYGSEECWKDMFLFLVETMETAVKSWHETSSVDARVHFLLDKEKTQTDKYAPIVNIDKAFESPHTHSNCFPFLRQYAEESFSKAACLVTPKSIIAYPQIACFSTHSVRIVKPECLQNLLMTFYACRSGRAKDQESGNMPRVMVSLFNLSHLPCESCGLYPVQMKRDRHCAGIQRFWTLVLMKLFPGYTNKSRPDLDNARVAEDIPEAQDLWLVELSGFN